MSESCENCRFAREGRYYGLECHRRAPQTVSWTRSVSDQYSSRYGQLEGGTSTSFPTVHGDDWCGEWSAKEVAP